MPQEFDLTVTSKGQVTLPAAFRKAANITDGSKLRLIVQDDGEVRLRRRLTLDEIAGSLTSKVRPEDRNFTHADIDAAIAAAMDEQEDRVREEGRSYRRKSRASSR